jgi:hypothetical protein
MPCEEEQDNRAYTIKLSVKYTLSNSKKILFQNFKEYFAHLTYFNGPLQICEM